MRAPTSLLAGLVLVLAACGGTEPTVTPAPSPSAAAPAPTPAAGSDSAAATAAPPPSAVPSATPSAVASAPPAAKAPASPCPTNMALVPGGTFKMSRYKADVTVAPLCMDVSETTADEYAACVKAGKCNGKDLKCAPQATYETAGQGDHPVVCVDFDQATTYCKAQNKRLASDEEWEWAARGGPAGHKFAWGDDSPKGKVCWSGESVLVGTCPVGKTPGGDSPQGIHDLAGNVYEWTTSRNDGAGPIRVGRGGSWKESAPEGLTAARPGPGFKVTYRCSFLGIRCVVEPQKP